MMSTAPIESNPETHGAARTDLGKILANERNR